MFSQPLRRTSSAALLIVLAGSLAGCRVQLPAKTQSNLWARAVEDRADWHLAQQGQPPNSTHREKCMSDWTKGYYRGYSCSAMSINQLPKPNYPAVWSPRRDTICNDESQLVAGYQAGSQQAAADGLINVVPTKTSR